METQPFIPDDDYCVYCHARAAGPCADCGALCCGDCVEVVLRFSTSRAVCQPCLAGAIRTRAGVWRWVAIATALLAGAGVLLYRLG